MGLGTVIAGIFGGRQTPSLGGITYTPATVAGGAAAGASAGSLASTLSGTVSYAVLSGALAVNASTGALTTTGTAPSSGSIAARVIADNGSQIVGAAISVPVQAAAVTLAALTLSSTAYTAGTAAGAVLATIGGKTSGSTVSIASSDTSGIFAVNGAGTQLLAGVNFPASGASTPTVQLTETLAGATNSPKTTSVAATVAAAQTVSQQVATTTPIAPENLTSTGSIIEYYVVDSATAYSDKAATTLASVGQSVNNLKPQKSRAEHCETGGSGGPILTNDAQAGLCLQYDGSAALLYRVAAGVNSGTIVEPKTTLIIYNSPNDGAGRAFYRSLFNLPGSNSDGYGVRINRPTATGNSVFASDTIGFYSYRNDGSEISVPMSIAPGGWDCVVFRSDGTTYDGSRAGKTSAKSAITTTGSASTPKALVASKPAMLGCEVSPSGALSHYYNGKIKAFVTFTGRISDAELPGLMQWAQNLCGKKWSGKYLFVGFSGSGGGELGTNQGINLAQSDSLAGPWKERPCLAQTGVVTPNNSSPISYRDITANWDDTSQKLFVITSGNAGQLPIFMSTDGINVNLLSFIDCTKLAEIDTTVPPFCPAFCKNKDGTLWKDANGLPMVQFQGFPSGATGTAYIYSVQPLDSTWTTGGAWGTPARVAGLSDTNRRIDTNPILIDGTWYCYLCSYSDFGTGGIRYATAAAPQGPYTDHGVDPFGFGAGFEGPQLIWTGGTNYTLQLDKDGTGYANAYSTAGPTGPFSTPAAIAYPGSTDFIFEQGEVIPLPANFPNPGLQSS